MHADHDDRLARRNALVLAAAQAFGGANATIVFATAGLSGLYLSGTSALATLPISLYVVGTALGTIPASMLSRRFGRRPAFMIGAMTGIAGGLTAAFAILWDLFVLFNAGTFLCGFYAAFVQLYRFAAADTASPSFRPRAISWVLAGGLAAGILGPQLVILSGDLTSPIPFAGAYLVQAAITLFGLIPLGLLRIPRPLAGHAADQGRPLRVIARERRFLIAVFCGVASYGLMNYVMTSTPLAMVACGHTGSDAALTIQWHVLGMFAPSFFTGALITRFGVLRVVSTGFLLVALCGVVALSGETLWHFDIALVLLGVGWNFSFIGATAMVAACHAPGERNKVQALNDFVIFGTMAVGSLLSGGVLDRFGWEGVNFTLFPVVGLAFVALTFAGWRERKAD